METKNNAVQPAPRSDEALQLIADGAARLISQANDLGVVLTVEQKPLRPLAMGHYETKFSVRAARERAQ